MREFYSWLAGLFTISEADFVSMTASKKLYYLVQYVQSLGSSCEECIK